MGHRACVMIAAWVAAAALIAVTGVFRDPEGRPQYSRPCEGRAGPAVVTARRSELRASHLAVTASTWPACAVTVPRRHPAGSATPGRLS